MLARALANAGAAKVYIAGRRLDVLEQAAAAIAPPGVVVPVACDVTSQDALTALAAHIEQDAGFLNLLLCNAGIGGPQVAAPPEPSSSSSSVLFPTLKWSSLNLSIASLKPWFSL